MSRFTKYKLYQKYETRGSQEAIPCYPSVFSIDGDGTMPLVIVEENSRDCGYTGETQPIYRWYTLPIDTYYYCDACQEAQYKWVNLPIAEDWECVGTTKYYKQKKMVSVDGGSTWTDVTPPQYQRGALYEQNSQSCGYRTRTSSGSPYCEGYDKYVDVYSQYSTDGGNTWQTTATTNVLLERYSSDCGYVPLTRWVESGWTCIGYDKYVNNVQQISYDDGQTWQNTSNTSASTLIEANSSDCGYEVKYRTTSGTPYCNGYDKYVDVYSQVSYDMGSTWQTTATTPTMIEHNSTDCGYEIKYRTTTGSPYCTGYDKYVDVYSQVSYDMGSTWETTATTPTMVEHNSYDCGYVGYRWTRTNSTLCIDTGYTQIDYIERDSSHTARISDIGTTLTDTMKFQLKVYPTNGGGSHVIGNDGTNDKDDYRVFWAGSNGAGDAKIYYDYGDDGSGGTGRRMMTPSTISSLYEIEIGNYYVKDLTNNSYILSGDTVSNANVVRTIGLFGGGDYGRIYYLKVYEGSTLTKNFIPVRRNSDNLVTLYDTISGTYLSATDGTFKGSDE